MKQKLQTVRDAIKNASKVERGLERGDTMYLLEEALTALDEVMGRLESEKLIEDTILPFVELFGQYDYEDYSQEAGEERGEFRTAAKAAIKAILEG